MQRAATGARTPWRDGKFILSAQLAHPAGIHTYTLRAKSSNCWPLCAPWLFFFRRTEQTNSIILCLRLDQICERLWRWKLEHTMISDSIAACAILGNHGYLKLITTWTFTSQTNIWKVWLAINFIACCALQTHTRYLIFMNACWHGTELEIVG